MSLRLIPRRTLHWALLSLVFCLSAAPLDVNSNAQTPAPVVRPMPLPSASQQSDTDDDSATPPATPAAAAPASTTTAPAAPAPATASAPGTGDTPMPTHPYVLPPTSVRPSAPAIVDDASKSAPHPIYLPPPPDETPARTTARTTKPAPVPSRSTGTAPKPAIASRPAPPPAAKPATQAPSVALTPATKPAVTTPAASPAPTAPAVAATPVVTAPAPSPEPQQSAPATAPAADAAQTAAPGVPSSLGANTFGFYAGETRDQIIAAIGKDNILKQQGDILEVAAAPKPDPNFDSFLLIVGPTTGLVKLIATGKDIEDDATGRQMKLQFAALKAALSTGYGEPSDNFDFLDVKATHRSPGQFMLALTNNERSLAAYWTKKDFGNQITSISLSGNGLGDDTGYLSIEYEFAGYHDYLAAKK